MNVVVNLTDGEMPVVRTERIYRRKKLKGNPINSAYEALNIINEWVLTADPKLFPSIWFEWKECKWMKNNIWFDFGQSTLKTQFIFDESKGEEGNGRGEGGGRHRVPWNLHAHLEAFGSWELGKKDESQGGYMDKLNRGTDWMQGRKDVDGAKIGVASS